MIAVKRLQSLFWLLLVALGALSAYLISLRVATERNALNAIRSEIARSRSNIRYMETEFSARANMRQLEKWNAEDFRYSTPPAAHYLEGERALAHLDGIERNGPDYVAPPVMVAMVETNGDLPSASVALASSPSPASTQIRSDNAVIRNASDDNRKLADTTSPETKAQSGNGRTAHAASISPIARKAERMAMLDSRLLDDGERNDIGRHAASEVRKGGR